MNRYQNYQASCAVCGSPADPDCPTGCESERLTQAIDQAESAWLDKMRSKTREWVANTAIRHVTTTFKQMKEVRLTNHEAYIRALPYFAIFDQYNGNPPINPHYTAMLRRQIHEAEVDLRRNIDSDWRQCVVRYPEVLNHYYSMVGVNIPKEAASPMDLIPPVPMLSTVKTSPLERTKSITRDTAAKKARRNSKLVAAKGDGFDMEMLSRMMQDISNNGASGSRDPLNGYSSGLGGMSGGLGGLGGGHQGSGGLSSMMTGAGLGGLTGLGGLAELNGLGRSSSKAGRSTPNPDGMPTRKKRQSKDYMATGRATAPPARSPFAPPQGWSSGGQYPF